MGSGEFSLHLDEQRLISVGTGNPSVERDSTSDSRESKTICRFSS
jgi:hypothetical protein